jgi:LacI family transcriptional regulator, gluconate utilization system Gnt-I transcriptional repressor
MAASERRSGSGNKLKRPGMREIALRAGVSPITVSRALKDPGRVLPETRVRILEAIRHFKFIPDQVASSMRGTGRIIGTMVPPLINSGIAEQVQGMSDEVHESGYQLLLIQGDFDLHAEEEAIRTLLGWRPAGLILQAFVQSEGVRTWLFDSGVPVVEISEIRGKKPIDMAIGISNFEVAYEMTAHLATKGYKRIGFVSTPIHGNDRLQQRRIGYRKAVRALGLPHGPDLEAELPLTPEGGAEAVRILTARDPKIDVIFFSSDTLAIGAVQECHRRGWRIPDRLAVAGYGDLDLAAQLYPSLTTVRVPRYDMGRQAVRQLLRRLSGDTRSPTIVSIGFQIMDRESA